MQPDLADYQPRLGPRPVVQAARNPFPPRPAVPLALRHCDELVCPAGLLQTRVGLITVRTSRCGHARQLSALIESGAAFSSNLGRVANG